MLFPILLSQQPCIAPGCASFSRDWMFKDRTRFSSHRLEYLGDSGLWLTANGQSSMCLLKEPQVVEISPNINEKSGEAIAACTTRCGVPV